MSSAVTVTLGEMGNRAKAHVASGRYASVSEVVRAGLRALDREEEILDNIVKAKVAESLANPGPRIPFDEAIRQLDAALFAKS
jgi:antitoxin ParD1/3/4